MDRVASYGAELAWSRSCWRSASQAGNVCSAAREMVAAARCPHRVQRGPPHRASCVQWSRAKVPSGMRNTCASVDNSGCNTDAGGQQNWAT
eukprot:3899970-Pyramimonas_sp.AAC.1